ncbi:MAG: ATP-binding cassette domain-containing protein [Candidatus Nanopelagicales bacterium]|jgi:energy-coupling factor transport system ATP-binding protein|nr:ATP-binding cassette domain-containing protein [Candidatus Nanopelagicales bacterium]
MIQFDHVSFQHAMSKSPVLHDLNLVIPEGDLTLVIGRTGSGKSTFLNLINGLVPHFTGGTLSGRVIVNGLDTRENPPRDLAGVVGTVGQNPRAGFTTDTVEDELAYTMESLGFTADVMRRRVEETLDLLGLAGLRNRSLDTLSGGEQQRVAIGAALTAGPKILVLDEPTSALDPTAAEEVLAAVSRLVHDLAITVVMAEHRLERVVEFADHVLRIDAWPATLEDPAEAMRDHGLQPPVVRLGQALGWQPLPLSVRSARRQAATLRLAHFDPPAARAGGERVATMQGAGVRFGGIEALRGVDVALRSGQITALMGRNGAGKSTLINLLAGAHRPDRGRVSVDGQDPCGLRGQDLLSRIAYVPQDPTDLFYTDSVAAECAATDRDTGQAPGSALGRLKLLVATVDDDVHPRDLSAGQQLALALAIQLASTPEVVLLDEPTRGLDYPGKVAFAQWLDTLARSGCSVLVATHDVEFVAVIGDRVIVMADGEVVTDADVRTALTSSPAFAPQVQKVLAPLPVLTVEEACAL